MPRPYRRIGACLLAAGLLLPAALGAQPLRLSSRSFDERAVIEVRDLPGETSEPLIRQAFALIAELERLTDRRTGPVAELNQAAGDGPQPVALPLRELLAKAADFCVWSGGAHGPLGGRIYDLWGHGQPLAEAPTEAEITAALETAACNRMAIDSEAGTAQLAPGSRVDLTAFAVGFAVDRAIDHLRAGGSTNAWVQIGLVQRGIGAGAGGRGWRAEVTDLETESRSLAELHLQDRALAVAATEQQPLQVSGMRRAAYIDQRTPRAAPIVARPGMPVEGVLAVAVVTELAVDAQGLAGALFVIGSVEGQFRLGGLRPTPAAIWLLGGVGSEPIVTSSHWSQTHE